MSNTRRIGLIAAGTAVAVLAFLLLRPTPAPEPAPTPEQASDTDEQRSRAATNSEAAIPIDLGSERHGGERRRGGRG